jgi:hypothetical protein
MESWVLKSAADPVLTMEQMRFARQHRARPGRATTGHGRVLFYRDDEHGTTRWLVDARGEILDSAFLKYSGTKPQLREGRQANGTAA